MHTYPGQMNITLPATKVTKRLQYMDYWGLVEY
jgi:hypothetical protein